jgi:glutamine amidotransferase
MIAIVDYDVGNITAVANMLLRLGVKSVITSDPKQIAVASKIILPGNGSFDACMKNLKASGILPVLEHRALVDAVPLLGICVGAQMLGHRSEEGVESGLGWINMTVQRFPARPGFPVPHMGWCDVKPEQPQHALLGQLEQDARFYFVHSYHMAPTHSSDILLKSSYGQEFAAAVAHNNLFGVQFHPEKSHRYGKQLLAAFAKYS